MNNRLPMICALVFLGGLSGVPSALAGGLSNQTGLAVIDFVKGYATVYPKFDSTSAIFAKRGMAIGEQDQIITGDDGFVSLSLASGTVVSIQPSSLVYAEKLDCPSEASVCQVTLNAVKGSINANVDHSNGADMQFIINTPYASAAVRGTVFDLDINNERLLAGVTEGRVDVISESGTVQLQENFATKVLKDQPPTTPKLLLSAPQLLPGPTRFDDGAELHWNQVGMASEYLVALADQDGLVYRAQSDETKHAMQTLDVGTYNVQIRAADAEGFLGSVAQRQFDVVKIDQSLVGPKVNATINETEFAVMVEQQPLVGDKIELHFSTSEEFDLLSTLDVSLEEVVSAVRVNNSIFVRARGVLSNTEVTPFGPTIEISGIQ